MRRQARIGSVIPVEGVDPHTGSYLDYGVVTGWQDRNGNPCRRKDATYAIVEPSGRKFDNWNDWCEEHVYKLVTLDEFESNREGGDL